MQQFGDKVTFVGMAGLSQQDEYAAFVAKHGLQTIDNAIDPDGNLWSRFDVAYQPAWVFINQDGEVVRHAGGLSEADMNARVQALIDG